MIHRCLENHYPAEYRTIFLAPNVAGLRSSRRRSRRRPAGNTFRTAAHTLARRPGALGVVFFDPHVPALGLGLVCGLDGLTVAAALHRAALVVVALASHCENHECFFSAGWPLGKQAQSA